MGSFDYIYCDYSLPSLGIVQDQFQSKSLNCDFDTYRITKDGQLIFDSIKNNKNLSLHNKGDKLNANGTLRFYTTRGERITQNWEWLEFRALFKDGKLQNIERLLVTDNAYM